MRTILALFFVLAVAVPLASCDKGGMEVPQREALPRTDVIGEMDAGASGEQLPVAEDDLDDLTSEEIDSRFSKLESENVADTGDSKAMTSVAGVPGSVRTCRETDVGLDIKRKGTNEYIYLAAYLKRTDDCAGNVTLTEYYCDSKNYLRSIPIVCAKGCLNGYCKECNSDAQCSDGKTCNAKKMCELAPHCEDSDPSDQMEKPGVVRNAKGHTGQPAEGAYADFCAPSTGQLVQHSCAPAGELVRTPLYCPTGYRCENIVEEDEDGSPEIGRCVLR